MSNRVALFFPSLAGGGAERVMVNLASGLFANNVQVEVVLAKAEGPYLAQIAPGIRVVDLRAGRVLVALPALVRYLRTTKPSVLLTTLSHANLVAIWASRLAGVNTKIVIREANTVSQSAGHAPTLRDRLMPLLMRRFYPWADLVIAPSQGVLDDLRRNFSLPPNKLILLHNPVVSEEILARSEELLSHPWFASNQPPVLLGVGRLTRQKDFSTLIRAFAMASERQPLRLMILGEGEERSQLEALVRKLGVADRVALPGFAENPFNYMRQAALFVLSSAWEGLPNVLIQALACGAQVVATDCPSGPAEILENGRLGPLVPVGDVDALATAILASLDRQKDLTAFRQNRIDRAMDFSVEKVVRQYQDALFSK